MKKEKTQKILLVDDEPDILEIVGYNLTQEGYQILLLLMVKKEAIKKRKRNS
jgi:two-component system alkaline phosphatase synthesis response regulator PhoP